MDKIEKIRQEIERHRQAIRVLNEHTAPEQMSKTCVIFQYSDSILSTLNSFLDTLSEEPDKNLEEAAYKYSFDSRPSIYGQVDVIDAFKAGAEWQASQMPMPEDTVLFQKGVAEGRRLEREDMLRDAMEGQIYGSDGDHWIESEIYENLKGKEGDKVRIVVLKEEE